MNSENTEYLLDTYAWIEYFIASKEGEKVNNLVKHQIVHTSIISIAELSDKYHRENLMNGKEDINLSFQNQIFYLVR